MQERAKEKTDPPIAAKGMIGNPAIDEQNGDIQRFRGAEKARPDFSLGEQDTGRGEPAQVEVADPPPVERKIKHAGAVLKPASGQTLTRIGDGGNEELVAIQVQGFDKGLDGLDLSYRDGMNP